MLVDVEEKGDDKFEREMDYDDESTVEPCALKLDEDIAGGIKQQVKSIAEEETAPKEDGEDKEDKESAAAGVGPARMAVAAAFFAGCLATLQPLASPRRRIAKPFPRGLRFSGLFRKQVLS